MEYTCKLTYNFYALCPEHGTHSDIYVHILAVLYTATCILLLVWLESLPLLKQTCVDQDEPTHRTFHLQITYNIHKNVVHLRETFLPSSGFEPDLQLYTLTLSGWLSWLENKRVKLETRVASWSRWEFFS